MKTVRVLKEMPGCIVGQVYVPNEDSRFGFDCFQGVSIDWMVNYGWLEIVEEDKSLAEKLDFLSSLNREDRIQVAQIAKKHYLDAFDKVRPNNPVPNIFGDVDVIRKALEDG